jgi:uncharacterized membrane protein
MSPGPIARLRWRVCSSPEAQTDPCSSQVLLLSLACFVFVVAPALYYPMRRMSLRRHEQQQERWLHQRRLFEQRQQELVQQQQSILSLPAPASSLAGESVQSHLGQVSQKSGFSKTDALPSASSPRSSASAGAASPASDAGAVVPAPAPRILRLRPPPPPSIPLSQLLLPYAVFVPGVGALLAAAQYVCSHPRYLLPCTLFQVGLDLAPLVSDVFTAFSR